FKHDEDAPFYRVDFQLGRVILTINSAHPFFKAIYEPLSKLSKVPVSEDGEQLEIDLELAADMLPTLELLLLSPGTLRATHRRSLGACARSRGLLSGSWSGNSGFEASGPVSATRVLRASGSLTSPRRLAQSLARCMSGGRLREAQRARMQ